MSGLRVQFRCWLNLRWESVSSLLHKSHTQYHAPYGKSPLLTQQYLAKGILTAFMMRLLSSLIAGREVAKVCGHLLSTIESLPQSLMVRVGGPGGGGGAWASMARGLGRARGGT